MSFIAEAAQAVSSGGELIEKLLEKNADMEEEARTLLHERYMLRLERDALRYLVRDMLAEVEADCPHEHKTLIARAVALGVDV